MGKTSVSSRAGNVCLVTQYEGSSLVFRFLLYKSVKKQVGMWRKGTTRTRFHLLRVVPPVFKVSQSSTKVNPSPNFTKISVYPWVTEFTWIWNEHIPDHFLKCTTWNRDLSLGHGGWLLGSLSWCSQPNETIQSTVHQEDNICYMTISASAFDPCLSQTIIQLIFNQPKCPRRVWEISDDWRGGSCHHL